MRTTSPTARAYVRDRGDDAFGYAMIAAAFVLLGFGMLAALNLS
ncbi:MAG TPA: hypothetical protein VKI44_15585 [Acetobacteraceae bacterium]|nr:hypothetical protein [Acetobacteraceae bacterium]